MTDGNVMKTRSCTCLKAKPQMSKIYKVIKDGEAGRHFHIWRFRGT